MWHLGTYLSLCPDMVFHSFYSGYTPILWAVALPCPCALDPVLFPSPSHFVIPATVLPILSFHISCFFLIFSNGYSLSFFKHPINYFILKLLSSLHFLLYLQPHSSLPLCRKTPWKAVYAHYLQFLSPSYFFKSTPNKYFFLHLFAETVLFNVNNDFLLINSKVNSQSLSYLLEAGYFFLI